MNEADIIATFAPAAGDRAALSKRCRGTLKALYQHPLSHNLEWSDVFALFEKLGSVDQKPHNEIAFGIGGEHHRVSKAHGKDLSTADVMTFRHMLTRAGWAPQAAPDTAAAPAPGAAATAPDLLVVVEHHEARLYHLAVQSEDPADHVIRPYDPHHFLHHLAHKDEARERGQRSPEDHGFYERIAQAVMPGGHIVLIGHGKGHSNAAHHLDAFIRQHHPDLSQRVVCEVVADLPALTAPQLLELGRRALTVGSAGAQLK